MKLRYLGVGSFGSYDFDGRRLEAAFGHEFECSERMATILLTEQPDRFMQVGAEVPVSDQGGEPATEAPADRRATPREVPGVAPMEHEMPPPSQPRRRRRS